jgi:hypothetical protein
LFFLGCFCAILRSGNRLAGCNRLKLYAVHNILRLGLGRLRRCESEKALQSLAFLAAARNDARASVNV